VTQRVAVVGVLFAIVVGTGGAFASTAADATGGASATRIVFARSGTGPTASNDIWTMDANGRNARQLTDDGLADLDPAWSPDGSRIVWARFETQVNVGPSDLWIMQADGSHAHALTHDRADIYRPSWSPDGKRIAFQKDYAIWIVNADGTGEHRISPVGAFDFDPDWSPDGRLIAFVSSYPTGGVDLSTMWPDGSHRRRLARTPSVFDERPAWSPDGTRIAFSGDDDVTSWHVYIVGREGADPAPLVDAYSLDPAWFPDGSSLAVYACVSTCGQYRVRSDGHGLRRFSPSGPTDIELDLIRP
jgi:Tol biopolymer transport system component